MSNKSPSTEHTIKSFQLKKIMPGSILALIGKRGTGKSVAVKSLCYHFRHIPHFVVISKTEKDNAFFSDFIPESCIYHKWEQNLLAKIFQVQSNLIKKYGKSDARTHMVLIIDDYLCDKKIWKIPEVDELFMNGRHKNITFMFTMQYPMGISPGLRDNIDFSFVYKQNTDNLKKKIFENYVGIFDKLKEFKTVLDATTVQHTCLVANNSKENTEGTIESTIFRYKAPYNLPKFRSGSPMFWSKDPDYCDKKRVVKKDGLTIKFD